MKLSSIKFSFIPVVLLISACATEPKSENGKSAGRAVVPRCVIKGNISSSGERIYHVPGQRYYADTVISPRRGERMFCTEAEARRAGWRKARV